MSKNAVVVEDHFGDDGSVQAGQILRNVTVKRFEELEKRGLVREATAEDLEAGDQIAFEKDKSGEQEQLGDDAEADAEVDEKKEKEPDNKKAADPKNKSA